MAGLPRRTRTAVMLIVPALAAAAAFALWRHTSPPAWTVEERALIASLWLDSLPPLPADPSNRVADDPRAAAFGHRLFFETRFSSNGTISCATCHQPIRNFTDGLPKGVAIGIAKRNTPSIVGTAYSPWLYWDGRRDSQWAQALSPLEDPDEHASSRQEIIDVVRSDEDYRERYRALFGPLPDPGDAAGVDRAFANIGKAIAAYERLLLPGESRFDRYVAHLEAGGDHVEQEILSTAEIRGLRLFIGAARCTECHNGPLMTNNEFHNTGLPSVPGDLPDRGRVDGVREVLADPFNCLGEFSDATTTDCAELRYVRTGAELIGATRTPSLRNLDNTAPYQRKGQFGTLGEVLGHYNDAPDSMIGHNEAKPIELDRRELADLEAFLGALTAPVDADPRWLAPPAD